MKLLVVGFAACCVGAAAAAFRRLCVETVGIARHIKDEFAAAFRRLCVETPIWKSATVRLPGSRLQAAVC